MTPFEVPNRATKALRAWLALHSENMEYIGEKAAP